jgi:hypothetical protein
VSPCHAAANDKGFFQVATMPVGSKVVGVDVGDHRHHRQIQESTPCLVSDDDVV